MIYSQSLLRLMGTELATDLAHNNHQDAETEIDGGHVILNASEDASVGPNDRKSVS